MLPLISSYLTSILPSSRVLQPDISQLAGKVEGMLETGDAASQKATKKAANATNYTLAFTHTFEFTEDVCYFTFCHPYTYTDLQNYLYRLQVDKRRRAHVKRAVLCKTIAGNVCDVLTITAPAKSADALLERVVIILTARVHPGESNASWIMQGMMDFLTSEASEAVQLRERYIFKVIPMLNPDGVINGNYRTSLSGTDLNRKWSHPDVHKHPTIFHTKELIRHIKEKWQIGLVLDVHGHSRKQGAFFYGCVPDKKMMRPPSPPYYLSARDQSSANAEAGSKVQEVEDVLSLFSSLEFMAPPPTPLMAASTQIDMEQHQQQQKAATSWTISNDPLKNAVYPSKSCTLRDVLSWRVKLLPRILDATVSLFSLESCSFKMQKGKASTMRMVAFTELGVDCVYTIEASLAGKEPYHFGAADLINFGRELSCCLLTVYPSLAPRSASLYDVPIATSPKQYSYREALSMFAHEMSFWKQLYRIETCAGSGASLLSESGILEVTAKDDMVGAFSSLGRIDEHSDSDKESVDPPPPPGTPIDLTLSSRSSRKEKAKAKANTAAVKDAGVGDGKAKKKGTKPWKVKEKRAIKQLSTGDGSNWCFDAAGIAFPPSKDSSKKQQYADVSATTGVDDAIRTLATSEGFMSSTRSFLVNGAAASGIDELAAQVSGKRLAPKDVSAVAFGEANFQLRAAPAIVMGSPVTMTNHSPSRRKSDFPDSSPRVKPQPLPASTDDGLSRGNVGGSLTAVTLTRSQRRPNTAAVETISRYLETGEGALAGIHPALLSTKDSGAAITDKKPPPPHALSDASPSPSVKRIPPGVLSKHIMESLRDRNSKCVRSR